MSKPFYRNSEWRHLRKRVLIAAGFKCARCGCSLPLTGKQSHVHHKYEVRWHPAVKLEPANLEALCITCHNAEHAERRNPGRGGCDIHGNPLSKFHPWHPDYKKPGGTMRK